MKSIEATGIWINKKVYEDAETIYYESQAKASLTPLAGEVAKARQRLIESRNTFTNDLQEVSSVDPGAMKFIEKKVVEFEKSINTILQQLNQFDLRVGEIEKSISQVLRPQIPVHEIRVSPTSTARQESKDEGDDDVDLFGSDSEGEDEAAQKIKEERLAAYNAKKSKKPALIAKSNIIFDIKPWDDETDMKKMEAEVRKIETEGLLWGTGKLVPLAYGIHKLQLSCVVEDDKVSTDWLEEQIMALEDYVQSVDIAAFNKI